ncbi:hypothetical protein BGZ60DRAFT_385078, partial [Tricladium varicosporioides]
DTEIQIEFTYENIDQVLLTTTLSDYGGVHSIRSIHVSSRKPFPIVVEMLKKRILDHRSTRASTGMPKLAFPEMVIEIEVGAWNNAWRVLGYG